MVSIICEYIVSGVLSTMFTRSKQDGQVLVFNSAIQIRVAAKETDTGFEHSLSWDFFLATGTPLIRSHNVGALSRWFKWVVSLTEMYHSSYRKHKSLYQNGVCDDSVPCTFDSCLLFEYEK